MMQVFGNTPGNRDSIVSGCTSSDFVQDNQTSFADVVDDGSGFTHLYHKGRFPSAKVIAGPNTCKYPVCKGHFCSICRYITSHMGHKGNQCGLSEQCTFTTHIRTSNYNDLLTFRIKIYIVGNIGFGKGK